MREWHASVTSDGQVMIPAEVRALLGISPHGRVAFVVDGGEVRLQRRQSVTAMTAGALWSGAPPLSADELRAAAEKAIADATVERSGS